MPGTAISPPRFDDGVDYIRKAFMAVEKVERRLRRTVAALEGADIPYAIVGGHAVAFWVATRDPEAVRNTRDVGVMIDRGDFGRVVEAMEADGFEYHHVNGIDLFIDGPDGKPSGGIHLLYAGEVVNEGDPTRFPTLDERTRLSDAEALDLEALVRTKLVAYRRKDQTHLLDMIGVGLIDGSWPARFPPPLGQRLQTLLDDPDG